MADQVDTGPFALQQAELLDDDGIERIHQSLLRHAIAILSRQGKAYHASGRLLAEDVASDTVIVMIENIAGLPTTRKWNPSKCSLMTFLRGVVESKISNYRTSAEVRSIIDCGGDPENFGIADNQDPHFVLEKKEEDSTWKYLFDRLVISLQDDDVSSALLSRIFSGQTIEASAVSSETSYSESDIRNSMVRIRRRARKLRAAL